MRLKGKAAIITGASAGIGWATALKFAQEGASVIAIARRQDRLEQLVTAAETCAGEIIPFVGDIALRATNESMIDFAVGKFGKVDILVNHADTMDDFFPVGEVTDEEWNRVMAVNLYGPMTAIRRAVQVMQAQPEGGTIVNVASIAGMHSGHSGAAYAASKAGFIHLSTHTALVYADKNIRCNCVNPGGIAAEISITEPDQLGEAKDKLGYALTPQLGNAEEVAAVVAFLASDEAGFVNGAVLTVDGGWTAYERNWGNL